MLFLVIFAADKSDIMEPRGACWFQLSADLLQYQWYDDQGCTGWGGGGGGGRRGDDAPAPLPFQGGKAFPHSCDDIIVCETYVLM